MAGLLSPKSVSRTGFTEWYLSYCDGSYARIRELLLPTLLNSQYGYVRALRTALNGSGRWLDIGCGHGFFPEWLTRRDRTLDLRGWSVVGVDLDADALRAHQELHMRVHGNIERLPFADASFSLVTANMVIEHV